MFGMATVPAVLLALGMIYCPESPRWLYKVGHINLEVTQPCLQRLNVGVCSETTSYFSCKNYITVVLSLTRVTSVVNMYFKTSIMCSQTVG